MSYVIPSRPDKQDVALRERVKEAQCLYAVSRLAAAPDLAVADMLRKSAGLLPDGLQYPDIACARITFAGKTFSTEGFQETPPCLSATDEMERLCVTVCYREDRPQADHGPFLKEEQHLLDVIALTLGVAVERKRAEEELKKSEEKYRFLVEKTRMWPIRSTPTAA